MTPHSSQDHEPLLASEAPTQIKILSQNIWCVFFKGGPQRRKRLQILIQKIKDDNPDIICLQEMHLLGLGLLLLCGDYLYVQRNLVQLGYIYHTDPKLSTPYFGGSSGCVIFSKYPMISSTSNVFQHIRPGRCKGWVVANIGIPNPCNLKVVTTHLEHKNKKRQKKQIKELAFDIISNVLDSYDADARVLCMGDFNACSKYTSGNEYDFLCEQLRVAGLKTDLYRNTEGTKSKLKSRAGSQSLDHLFINDACKPYVKDCEVVDYRNEERIMSDHLGLLTTFQF
eukprot:145621_1